MKRLVFLPEALQDIDRIYDYTEANFGFLQAEEYTRAVVESCRAVQAGRRMTRLYPNLDPQFRFHRYRSHLIFHRINEAGDIEIVRILHGRMNVEDHL